MYVTSKNSKAMIDFGGDFMDPKQDNLANKL